MEVKLDTMDKEGNNREGAEIAAAEVPGQDEPQNHCTYFSCLYNQETKLLLSTEAGKPPPCTISINEWAETLSLEVDHSDGTKEIKIPALSIRYIKVIQSTEVLFSWYENEKLSDFSKKWCWLTFKPMETDAVNNLVRLVQKLQKIARPSLGAILSFEGCGNLQASIGDSTSPSLEFDTYFFVVDKEVVALFKDTLERNEAALHFYKEPGDVAIEQVLSRKDLGHCEIKSPTQHLVFKLESVGANILLESIRKCKPVPKEWFRNDKALNDYLAEMEVQRHMELATTTGRLSSSLSLAGPSGQQEDSNYAVANYTDSVNHESIIDSLETEFVATPPDEQLSVMWAVMEAEIRDIINRGLVPGQSITSGGLDPNSCDHLIKCIDEIQDALFEETLGKAVSILKGTKQVFSECKFSVVTTFLKRDDLDILKRIYFRNK